MRECLPYWGRVSAWRSTASSCIVLFFLGASFVQAQDVAEAARKEQSRRAAQKTVPKHVYTDDELKKDRILTPEDEAKVAARKRKHEQVPAEEIATQPQPGEETTQVESLGEIARRYRKEKAAREAEEATKKSYSPFRYEVPQPAAAAPKVGLAPTVEITPAGKQPNFSDAIQPTAPQQLPQPRTARRVSPFQPRPLVTAPPLSAVPSMPSASGKVDVERPTPPVLRPAPERRSELGVRAITVQRGDSWWKLAAVHMGSGSRWADLRALNSEVAGPPELLKSGITVVVPDEKKVHVNSSSRTERSTKLRIKAGDTLWTLAREHLGRGSAWTCLANANPQIQDYRRMEIGTVVEMPELSAAGACAAPSAASRR
jgi:nucleoid-associated protein YgaU